jgi:hypothetical protein
MLSLCESEGTIMTWNELIVTAGAESLIRELGLD